MSSGAGVGCGALRGETGVRSGTAGFWWLLVLARCAEFLEGQELIPALKLAVSRARALTPQTAETDAIRFLVGTQSLRYDNQIHIIDFDDENNIINKNVLLHQVGEIWHISTSPADKGVLATCYNKTSDSKVMTCAAVWRMPKELESGSHESPDDSSSNTQTLELLCHLDNTAYGNMACVMWEPMGDGKKIISLADNNILLWDLQESSAKAV
ncbi:PREDICTED: protein TSSC1, partial [Buceros rhinoceros silvestris]|uniref:protein TSSC1 n=1 Tax=Buceros rhinoceros silvestris TaxID=175836 RepID=UPI000528A372